MRSTRLALLATCALTASALGGCDEHGSDGPGVDAGMADASTTEIEPCSERDPRPIAPEVFLGPRGLGARLRDAIASAESTLLLSIYDLTDAGVMNALAEASARGVAVRVLVDGDREAAATVMTRFAGTDVAVRAAPARFEYFHVKALIIDATRAIVMSANIDEYSLRTERNHGVVLEDPFDVADIKAIFEQDWNGGLPEADLACTRLVVSPVNSRSRIEALIRSAERELRLQQLSLSDRGVRDAISERMAAGVAVRIILADPAWIEGNVEALAFARGIGAEVRVLSRPENHAKLIFADDVAAFVGSENLSFTSLERNREIGVVVTEAESLTPLHEAFEADWALATP